MTVKKLKEHLNQFPDNMQVFVAERKTEFAFGLVNSCYTKEIRFTENPDDDEDADPQAKEPVVVIDEE